MEPRWITTTAPTTCLACRHAILPGSRAYSLTGLDCDSYCAAHGARAETAMRQHEANRERERRIIAGLPV